MSAENFIEKDLSQSESYFFDIVSEKLQYFFDQVCDRYSTSRILINTILKIENSSLDKGDISLFFSPGCYPALTFNLEEIAENLKTDLSEYFSDCIALYNNRLKLILNKSKSFEYCLQQVVQQKHCYGSHEADGLGAALILVHNDTLTTLTDFRTIKLAEHLASVMLMNGFKIYCDKVLAIDKLCFNSSKVQYYDCSCCNIESLYPDFEDKLCDSEWLLEEVALLENMKAKYSADLIVIDGKRYLEKNTEGQCNYNKNIGYIILKKNNYTDCFKHSAMMKHVLDEHACDVDVILHVVPLKKHFSVRQSGLILDILNKKKTRNIFLVHQQALAKNQENTAVESYRKTRLSEMEQALVHKYGEDILLDEGWKSITEILVETVMKFDFLFTSSSAPLKICCSSSGSAIHDKGGAFVQYNCARLATLFQEFEKCIEKGKYKPIPKLSEVDFSQLHILEEWNMFFNYVLPFPKLTADLVQSLKKREIVEAVIPTHKIVQMLVNLSHDFSVYYNKHKVLVEPYPQLLKKMYPRLYLLQAIHQIIKNGLMLLNLPAAEKM